MPKDTATTDCNVSCTLSDGNEIVIANERFRCLFSSRPSPGSSSTESTMPCSTASVVRYRRQKGYLCHHPHVKRVNHIPEWSEKEIIRLAPPTLKITVVAPP
jgi:hypothetical protein